MPTKEKKATLTFSYYDVKKIDRYINIAVNEMLGRFEMTKNHDAQEYIDLSNVLIEIKDFTSKKINPFLERNKEEDDGLPF